MHERSLVQQLIDQVRRESALRGLFKVKEVHLQVGEFSGVEPRLVQSAFAELAPLNWGYDVKLNLETVPLSAQCCECRHQFLVESFHFICPECQSGSVQITSGEELQLVSLVATRTTDEVGVR